MSKYENLVYQESGMSTNIVTIQAVSPDQVKSYVAKAKELIAKAKEVDSFLKGTLSALGVKVPDSVFVVAEKAIGYAEKAVAFVEPYATDAALLDVINLVITLVSKGGLKAIADKLAA